MVQRNAGLGTRRNLPMSKKQQELASCLLLHIHTSHLRRRCFTSETLPRPLYGWGSETGGDLVTMLMSALPALVSDAVVAKQPVGAVILGASVCSLWCRHRLVSFPVTGKGD